ncbi:MAG: hypothetical protein K6A63_02895 [Acholeplasmatales bacterium]|nr:hypothetical protein [Acholeplasmatales bacterium]
MNKLQKILVITISALLSLGIIILNIVMNFSELAYKISLWIIPGIAFINLILIAIFEYKTDYKSKRFTLMMHISYAVVAVLFQYLEKYLERFDSLKVMYYCLTLGLVLIVIILFNILNAKLPEKKPEINPNNLKNRGQK